MSIEDKQIQTEIEAEVLRALLAHLSKRSDVQNIDLMNLAGFCRNCLSKWYASAAQSRGIEISKEQARKQVYGMEYDDWKDRYQTDATETQKQAFERVMNNPELTS
ncbi:MAG TPA: DUF1244 domain-containing protein [Xanthomonadales bacterium]|nr:DUF1244 domain-containing protein [Xanthomonadales bacterium]